MTYEELIINYTDEVKVKEYPLSYGFKGLYKNNKIIIDSNICSDCEKACILAEELGHHFTTHGNILDQCDIRNVKQEHIARAWAYRELVPLDGFIDAFYKRIKNRYELAEHFGVTEEFLCDAVMYYKSKYGTCYKMNEHIIYFEPPGILKLF